jgi:hypothetical protein
MAVVEESQRRKDPDNSLGRIFFHLEYGLARTFRYALLIGVCSFVEESVKALASERIPDQGKSKEAMKGKKGSWLVKHVHAFTQLAGLDARPFQDELNAFNDLITLRNCITHSWGKVDEALDPQQTRDVVARLKGVEKTENVNLVETSSDGYLLFGDNFIHHAIWHAECVVDALFNALLSASSRDESRPRSSLAR